MKDPDIAELRRHVRNHGGSHRTERQGADFEEHWQPPCGVKNDGAGCRVSGFESRQHAADPHDRNHPDVEQESDKDHEVGAPPAVELADEVGAKEGDRVGKDTDRDSKDQREPTRGFSLEKFDESADAENVEHRQGTEKDAGEDQEHSLASRLEVRGFNWVQLVGARFHGDEDTGSQIGPARSFES